VLVTSSSEKPIHLNAKVGKANAALPPKFDIEQRLAGDVQRSILAPAAIGFGIVFGPPKAFASREADPPQRSGANGE